MKFSWMKAPLQAWRPSPSVDRGRNPDPEAFPPTGSAARRRESTTTLLKKNHGESKKECFQTETSETAAEDLIPKVVTDDALGSLVRSPALLAKSFPSGCPAVRPPHRAADRPPSPLPRAAVRSGGAAFPWLRRQRRQPPRLCRALARPLRFGSSARARARRRSSALDVGFGARHVMWNDWLFNHYIVRGTAAGCTALACAMTLRLVRAHLECVRCLFVCFCLFVLVSFLSSSLARSGGDAASPTGQGVTRSRGCVARASGTIGGRSASATSSGSY